MARRIYVGKLPPDARPDEVRRFFESVGPIRECRVMKGYGFIEYEAQKDADECVETFHGRDFQGRPLLVEFAKENRRREPNIDRSRRPPGIQLLVTGLGRDVSWQDLKDWGRDVPGGVQVNFADIDRDNPGTGILEYVTREEAETALRHLDGRDIRGRPVRVQYAPERRAPEIPPRYDDRGYYGGGRDTYYFSRGRSRSPPPRGRDEYYSRGGSGGGGGGSGGGAYYDEREYRATSGGGRARSPQGYSAPQPPRRYEDDRDRQYGDNGRRGGDGYGYRY